MPGRQALLRQAAAQHALFTSAQARKVGLTAKQVESGCRSGWWLRVYRSVYRLPGAPVTDEQRLLAAVLACGPGAGVRLLRAVLERRLEADGERPSALESAMDRLVVRFGVPRPVRQHEVAGTPYRLDYAWPDARVAVEVDGYGPHSSREAFQDDRARQNVLVLAGWTVLRFTWADLRGRPAVVAATVGRALGASRPA